MFLSQYLRIPLNMTLSLKGYEQRWWLMENDEALKICFLFQLQD